MERITDDGKISRHNLYLIFLDCDEGQYGNNE